MALSFSTVQEAYKIFNQMQEQCIPDLRIPAWPDDMSTWKQSRKDNPPTLTVLGWDRKYDDGWENLFFFVEDPSEDVIEKFKKLNTIRSNTSMCKKYFNESPLWIFGWF